MVFEAKTWLRLTSSMMTLQVWIYQKYSKHEYGYAIMEEASSPGNHVDVPPHFHGGPETRIQFGMICNFLFVQRMLHIGLSCAPASEAGCWIWSLWRGNMELGTHHVQDRYDKMGVENIYIHIYRYVSMHLCILLIYHSTDFIQISIYLYLHNGVRTFSILWAAFRI